MSSGRSRAYNAHIETRSFDRIAAPAALATALVGVAYALTFLVWERSAANDTLLALGSILALVVFVALYERLREVDRGWALLALLLGVLGAFGGATHGLFELANRINEAQFVPRGPYPTDPRGFSTFALTGLAVLVFSSLMRRGRGFDARLPLLGYAVGVVLLIVFLARLTIYDDDLLVVPAALAAVASPLWYAWLGRDLGRDAGRRT